MSVKRLLLYERKSVPLLLTNMLNKKAARRLLNKVGKYPEVSGFRFAQQGYAAEECDARKAK